jgi:hypothetical protein
MFQFGDKLRNYLIILVIRNAERHSREGLDIRTAKMREHDLESGSELVGNTIRQGKQRHRGLRRLLVNDLDTGWVKLAARQKRDVGDFDAFGLIGMFDGIAGVAHELQERQRRVQKFGEPIIVAVFLACQCLQGCKPTGADFIAIEKFGDVEQGDRDVIGFLQKSLGFAPNITHRWYRHRGCFTAKIFKVFGHRVEPGAYILTDVVHRC